MRGALDLRTGLQRVSYRLLVASLRKRVGLIAVLVVMSLLIAALPGSSSRTLATSSGRTVSTVQESLPLQFYRSVRNSFAAIGVWMAESLRSRPAEAVSTYQPVTAYLSPAPPFIDAPTNLTTTAASDTSLTLSWTAPAGGVDHYQIERSQSIAGPFLFRANTASTTFQDTSVTTDQAYLYRVRAVTSGGVPSVPSNMALGTTTSFEFNGAGLVGNVVKKQHVYDIRTAINAVRAVAGLAAATWTRSDLTNLLILANDVQELRTKLGEALTALSISVSAYTDPTLTAGVTLIKGVHFDELQVRSTRGSSSSFGPIDADTSTARNDPFNATGGGGENPLSRNFNWTLPLVSLRGRAGLDLNLALSYNSLVWTKVGSTVSFNDDNGFPGPGFRLGFPVIQQPYFNTEVQKDAYLLIGSDGGRTELRRVSTSGVGANLYEAANSSYVLLDTSTTPMVLRTAEGTQMTYELKGGEFKCTQVKDRNGNYITVSYTIAGHIDEVIDTLGRSIDFVYDANGWLTQIKQLWNAGTVTQFWARFSYTDVTIDTNFPGLNVDGPADSTQVKMLSKVTLPDDSYFQFSNTSWGQVWKITKHGSDNNPINYRSYDLPQTGATAHSDCPRFTVRKDWAKYWNGDTDGTTAAGEEVTTGYIVPVSDSWTMPDGTPLTGVRAQVTTPDGTIDKLYFVGAAGTATGWSRGLPVLVDTVSGAVTQRRAATTWTQDNTSVSYQLNPRVLEMNIYDPAGNRQRTRIDYQLFTFTNGTSCRYPRDVFEYDANASTVLRTTRTNYNTNTAYSDRRILGLPSEKLLYEGDVNAGSPPLKAKMQFVYDEAVGFDGANVPIRHDGTNYASNFVGRANLTKIIRHNVSVIDSTAVSTKYNRAGSVLSTKDAATHETIISYADSFSDSVNRNTFAYATTITDPDEYSSTAKYNFDFGEVTYQRTPQPSQQANIPGPERTFTYDAIGRQLQITNVANSSYTRFEYSTPSELRIDTYQTIQDGLGEARSIQITDGAGRVIASASQHPGSVGGYSGQRLIYDVMGRTFKTSNPTETSASGTPFQWNTAGDDSSAGWIYTEQTYDWRGRPLRTTHQNGAYKEASYSGCGCAGGQVVTLTDEGTFIGGVTKRRQQKIYSDALGRKVKTEILNWEGGSVYSATVNTYNVRDQIEQVTQYAGPVGSTPSQVTTMGYDGYGRQINKHSPEQTAGTATVWTYNTDDTISSITDARGASQTFTYNDRHLPTSITYAAPGGITVPSSVSYEYDAAGNRLQMTDGFGTKTYQYNALSRLTQETRQFPVGSFSINYSYNLAGHLMSVTDPFGASFSYTRDVRGQLKTVTGSPFAGVTNYISDVTYRAWGAPKTVGFGASTSTIAFNSRMQPIEFRGAMSEDYGYNADGTLASVVDLNDTAGSNPPVTLRFLSRRYSYDHVGRSTGGSSINSAGSPYNQAYGYDQFGNMTSRVGSYYNYNNSMPASDTATFTNDRRNGWTYNANGQVTATPASSTDDPKTMAYDAAGRMINSIETTANNTVTYSAAYDGDGQLARESTNTSPGTSDTSYIVRSTVLGDVLTRLDQSGNKKVTHVPAEGLLFATQKTSGGPFVLFTHRNPLGVSETNKAMYDPLGNFIPFQAHGDPRPPVGSYNSGSMSALSANQADPNSFAVGCVMDGMPTPCHKVLHAIERGRVRRLQILGPALTPEMVRLTMSLTIVGAKIDKGTPPEKGERAMLIEVPGGHIRVYPSQLWGLYVLAPGFQELFEQNRWDQDPEKNNDVDSITNDTKDCSITVNFTDAWRGLQAGPGEITGVQNAGYGVGFTVSGKVKDKSGTIGFVDRLGGRESAGRGTWVIQQYVSRAEEFMFQNTGAQVLNVSTPTQPDGPHSSFRDVTGNRFSYFDFPGPVKVGGPNGQFGNLTYYRGEWDFYVKMINSTNGNQYCGFKFHISMRLQNGKWEAHWGSRGVN